jgi:hypothetical protein
MKTRMAYNGGTNTVEDNAPGGWNMYLWTDAATPSGHVQLSLTTALAVDDPIVNYHHSWLGVVL